MTCAELDLLLADYLDGTLSAAEAREVESHMAGCPACAELAAYARFAMSFIDRAADLEPPAALATKIFHETTSGRHGSLGRPRGLRAWFAGIFAPLLEPRLVMGMALTVFSFTVMARCAGISPRQLRPSDLEPAKIWASADNQVHRTWERSVKFYENLKFVYEIQSRLREWNEQQEEEERNAAASRPVEYRRVPAQTADVQGRESK